MGATGLLLCGFLVAHLAGNLNIFLGEEMFNTYAEKLHSLGPLLVVAEIGLFVLFLVHILVAFALTMSNRAARGSRGYEVKTTKQEDAALNLQPRSWMVISGAIVLFFLVYHVAGMKFGIMDDSAVMADPSMFEPRPSVYDPALTSNDLEDVVDKIGEPAPFQRVVGILRSPVSAAIYVVGVIILGFHLSHGFSSAFRSLGLAHPRYTPVIRNLGVLFAVLMTVGFASIPLYIFFMNVGVSSSGG